jgi:(p)ppGpp synthase/HD superfamily hydrolase
MYTAAPRTPWFYEALKWVTESHASTQTYGKKYPYWFHVLAVADIAARYGAAEEVQIACLFHDLIEDTRRSISDIEDRFGNLVANWVAAVSDDQRCSRETRKAQLVQAAPTMDPHAVWVKVSDMHVNFTGIVDGGSTKLHGKYFRDNIDTALKILKIWSERDDLGRHLLDHIDDLRTNLLERSIVERDKQALRKHGKKTP